MFAIKSEIADPKSRIFKFSRQKTMYVGKKISAGDTLFIFASENQGGSGLVALGRVTLATAVPRKPGAERQTPRVSIVVKRTALARRTLGRGELKPCSKWDDGKPQTELNFKFYRQATNKIVGLSNKTSEFLRSFFQSSAWRT